jgi:hypothetical protein
MAKLIYVWLALMIASYVFNLPRLTFSLNFLAVVFFLLTFIYFICSNIDPYFIDRYTSDYNRYSNLSISVIVLTYVDQFFLA